MKRIHIVITVALLGVAGVVIAAPDVEPWRKIYQQYQYQVPQKFEVEVQAAFIDAGTLKSGSSALGGLTTINVFDAGAGSRIAGQLAATGSAQDAGTGTPSIQWGYGALSANDLAVTFTRAFGSAPSCVCAHTQTTNTNACGVKTGTAPSTTAVTFSVASGGTDVVFWQCMGHQ